MDGIYYRIVERIVLRNEYLSRRFRVEIWWKLPSPVDYKWNRRVGRKNTPLKTQLEIFKEIFNENTLDIREFNCDM